MKCSGKKLDITWVEFGVSEWTLQQCNSWVTAPAVVTPPLHTRGWHLPREKPSYHSTTETLGISSPFSARAEWGHLRWKHESNSTWPVRVKKWWQRSALKYRGVFSGSYTSHIPVLHPIPKIPHFNTNAYSTWRNTDPHHSEQSTDWGSPGWDPKWPGEGLQGWGLWGELAEATAATTELRGSAVASKPLKNV